MQIKKILLEARNQAFKDHSKIVFYFSSSIEDCFTLKNLLCETKCEILVYFFDKTKFVDQQIDYQKEQDRTIEILKFYQSNYRNFSFQEIPLFDKELKIFSSNSDDLALHCKILQKIYQQLGGFEYYLTTKDRGFFSQSIKAIGAYEEFKKQNLEIEILTPFADLKLQDFSDQMIFDCLWYNGINSHKIYNDNKSFIEALKLEKSDAELEKEIRTNTDYNLIHRYLLSNSTITICTKFVEKYGDKISNQMHFYCLSEKVIGINSAREKLITLSVVLGKISNDQINQILIKIVDYFAGNQTRTTSERIDEVDYFLRLYDHKITQKTKDILMLNSFKWKVWNNDLLLEKMIDLGGDVGELLITTIDSYSQGVGADILLDRYLPKIHQLQLDEALLKAFDNKLYNLCYKLIECGANPETIQFHQQSYGWNLWKNERSPDIKIRSDATWRKRDRVLIAEILKELGNPQKKVPPVIHITGSNGKGSTCAFLQSILKENGYSSHCFTSPSIIRENENYILANQQISDEQYYFYLKEAETAFGRIKNSDDFKQQIASANIADNNANEVEDYIGWAFIIPAIILAFSKTKADATIIEVITGGEFDLTNVFDEKQTIATIINSIIFGDNHAGLFGNIEGAANTKSRLAKAGVPIICASQEDLVLKVISKNAAEISCPLMVLGKDFFVRDGKSDAEQNFVYEGFGKIWEMLKPNLAGEFQINNAALALSALLANQNLFKLDLSCTSKAIKNAYQTGRFAEIKNDFADGYEKVYFGSSKYRSGSFRFNTKFSSDVIQSFTGYSDDYIGGSIRNGMEHFNARIFINRDSSQTILNDQLSQLNFIDKKYISSALFEMIKNQNKSKNLVIKTTGISSFPKEQIIILKQLHQSNPQANSQANFKADLAFAKKHQMLDEEQVLLMEGEKNSFCPYRFLANCRNNNHEKIYIYAAKELGILVEESGKNLKFSKNNITHHLSNAQWIGLDNSESFKLSCDKNKCSQIAEQYFDIPEEILLDSKSQNYQQIAKEFLQKHGQIVLKPNSGTYASKDVYFVLDNQNLDKEQRLTEHLNFLSAKYSDILAQEYIDAIEYRILFLRNQPIFLFKKEPIILVGDGENNPEGLIANWNLKARRVNDEQECFVEYKRINEPHIKLNYELENFLLSKGFSKKNIPALGQEISLNFGLQSRLKSTQNLEILSAEFLQKAIDYNQKIGLSLSGFDFFIQKNRYVFLEINPEPGMLPHSPKINNQNAIEAPKLILQKLFNCQN